MFPLFSRRCLVLILAASALALSGPPFARAASDGAASGGGAVVDVNFFYDTLKDDGSWYNTTEYGDVWQPYIAYKSDSWRPYTDGYWSYTDGGWMFVSNEDFGWAVYHYGRWTRLKDIGWAWVPGTDWAPAWVTWRASKPDGNGPPDNAAAPAPAAPAADDKGTPPPPPPPVPDAPAGGPPISQNYIGWAPLPPERVAYTEPDYTYGPTVDVDFGIEPYDYCFTDVRYFGAPYVAAVIFPFDRSYYYADRSVNITNIYYNRSDRYSGFYAGGPDYNRVRGLSEHPIPQYNLHQTGGAAAQRAIRNGAFNRVTGNTLSVPSPRFSRNSVGPDGRVTLTRAGALAKAEVNRGAPAAAADNPAYKQAQESFAKQGENFRAAHPNTPVSRAAALEAAGKGGATPETGPKIQTTERAQQEEREARQAAGGGSTPPAETGRDEALKERTGGVTEAHHEGGGAAAAIEGHQEPAAGSTRHSRHGTSRQTESHPATVTRSHVLESAGRSHAASVPHVVQRTAPPPPQIVGGGGGGEVKKKKKP